jgi:Domain of unknown function (DUF5071)
MKEYIPKTKDDLTAIHYLQLCSFDEIKDDINVLLEYLQDLHWNVARDIGAYLAPYVNNFSMELLRILSSNDNEWKFGILTGLVAESKVELNQELIAALNRIAKNPTDGEIYEGVNILAENIIQKSKG